MVQRGTMQLAPYGFLMLIRVTWQASLVALICYTLGRSLFTFPVRDRHAERQLVTGGAVGLIVMISAIVSIVSLHAAKVTIPMQSFGSAIIHGCGWLIFDLIGATGEELYGRVSILLVAAWFLGWRGAIVVSGLMFFAIHLDNPGVNAVWLFRLFLQGALLAWAVYQTGSFWWSIGYHTCWNWASAPLFGAVGSGYLDEGHVFDFSPTGAAWITGGRVGPEGS